MPIVSFPLRLVFYAADHRCRIHPLLLKKSAYHILDFSIGNVPSELVNWDALIRCINSILTEERFGLSDKAIMPDYDQVDPFSENQIIILFARSSHLHRKEFFKNMLACLRRVGKIGPFRSKSENGQPWKQTFPCPVITISEEDFMALYGETAVTDYAPRINWKHKRWCPNHNLRLYRHAVDHRVKFLDSSIWHRYVYESRPNHLDVNMNNKSFADRFARTLIEIAEYHALGLYRTRTAISTLEFQCRMFLNSYIQPIGDLDHHEAVTPFKFHSETFVREHAEQLLDFLKRQGVGDANLRNLSWDMLMVDDYAGRQLSSVSDTGTPVPASDANHRMTKKELIEYWISGKIPEGFSEIATFQKRSGLNARVTAHTHKPAQDKGYIGQGIEMLEHMSDGKPKMYDIILLDYLLGFIGRPTERLEDCQEKYSASRQAIPPIGNTSKIHFTQGLREYGHEFLLELDEQIHKTVGRFPRGPLGRFWIFPISSFPYAFPDKLRQLGMDNISDNWYISNGGDPVSSPEMFRFTFFQMLWQQISRCYLHPEGLARWLDRFNGLDSKKEWCKVVISHLEVEIQKIKLLRSINSEFCESIVNFIDDNKYELVLRDLLKFIRDVEKFGKKHPKSSVVHKFNSDHLLANNLSYRTPILSVLQKKLDRFLADQLIAHAEELKNNNIKFLKYQEMLYYIPDEIPHMNWFVDIDLNDKKISSLSEDFGKQSNLRKLDLSDNAFEKIPSALLELSRQKLRKLDLSGNPFTLQPGGEKFNRVIEGDEVEELLEYAKDAGLLK